MSQRLPGGTQTAFDNRIERARIYLFKAGLIERPRRATFIISQSGKELLLNPPSDTDADFLRSYDQFNQFLGTGRNGKEGLVATDNADDGLTPEEQFEEGSDRFSVNYRTRS